MATRSRHGSRNTAKQQQGRLQSEGGHHQQIHFDCHSLISVSILTLLIPTPHMLSTTPVNPCLLLHRLSLHFSHRSPVTPLKPRAHFSSSEKESWSRNLFSCCSGTLTKLWIGHTSQSRMIAIHKAPKQRSKPKRDTLFPNTNFLNTASLVLSNLSFLSWPQHGQASLQPP